MEDSDTREQAEEFLLLHRVAQRINSVLDFNLLLQQIVADVEQTFGYCRSSVLLKDDTTNELVITHGWTGDRIKIGHRFRIGQFGIAGHVGETEQTHYAPDVRLDPYYVIGHPSTRSELDIPLLVRGRLIGVFDLQDTAVDAFSPGRIRLLETLAGHVATAIDNARMFQRERVEKERMLKELEEAQAIQLSLLPSTAPQLSGFGVTGVSLPSRSVGGDWYDYVQMPDGRVIVALGDVAGKGMAAALLMSSTRSILRLVTQNATRPAEVLSQVNKILLSDFPMARFVTIVYALVDPKDRSVVFANAGHPPPLLAEPTSARFLEDPAGLPLGIREGSFSERTIQLPPGSRLVLYSDGVVEACNVSFEEYGRARLQEHFVIASSSLESLLEDVRHFSAGNPLADDATVVILESR
jgi:sigma-B regulation protein RsbU (phosphoserine phosphatase)